MSANTTNEILEGLLRGFVERVAHTQAAVVSSTDGIRMHVYGIDSNDDADQASAVSSGMFSLANGADRSFLGGAGSTRQIIAEVDGGLIFITRPASGTLLTVLASHDADLGLVGYEMKMLGQSIGPALATAPRISATG
ncbi:roadblock/LC7 domain-containing protein [Streptomyces aureus]|uniref:roadblock/LC7 domain-containing protein n=1 Tax=Streptomyces aureus TaxID=193461 RepID=UPI0005625F91|nr:roadblock/LC7 domain-containing protein [Streptomyces aureus]